MIFDIHTHCFPDALAPRAISKLAYDSGGLIAQTDGTFQGLSRFMKSQGVDAVAVANIATNPSQMTNVNNFAASIIRENVFPFGSVHPDAPDALDELERIKALGLKGIKFHPEYQSFYVDDEKMKPIYKKASELSLIVLFHAGQDFGFSAPYHCMPENMARALKWLDTPVIAAHWGGACAGQEVLRYLAGLPLFFDLSFGYAAKPRMEAIQIVEKHGVERLLFGSDCPWHSPEMELRLLSTLQLTEDEKDDILWNNAAKLLGIE